MLSSKKELVELIENCYLHELCKNYDESETHGEYQVRHNTLKSSLLRLRSKLNDICLSQLDEFLHEFLALIVILYKELLSIGPWNTDECIEYATNIDNDFKKQYSLSIENLLEPNSVYSNHSIFEQCMKYLHRKLIQGKFKRYPSFIHVYCNVIKQCLQFEVKINPMRTLPAALLLIDDYIPENKIRGLTAFKHSFNYLTMQDFEDSNYYEVLYSILSKLYTEIDSDITKLVLECTLKVLAVLPADMKIVKLNELLSTVISEIYMESNFVRKQQLLNFLSIIIKMAKTDSVKRKKKFMTIIYDNLELSMNEAVRPILLDSVLLCLETWLKYCWCVWNLNQDKNILSTLFKLLYVVDNEIVHTLQNIIIQLLLLSPQKEQQKILSSFDKTCELLENKYYKSRLRAIEEKVNI